jgi:hypothetical protein
MKRQDVNVQSGEELEREQRRRHLLSPQVSVQSGQAAAAVPVQSENQGLNVVVLDKTEKSAV